MQIPTEPIGSIPRPEYLIEATIAFGNDELSQQEFEDIQNRAIRETIASFEDTGSPVITDGEQIKPSFATYPIQGLKNLDPDGFKIEFSSGHSRQFPKLTGGPFRYAAYASSYLKQAQDFTEKPLKQAVIAPSALSLIYPDEGIEGYTRQEFLDDLVSEATKDIRQCLDAGAEKVQMDFTEGRLAVKLDPGKKILKDFIALSNRVLEHFSAEERKKIGVHTCPGGDRHGTHSADVDYVELLPLLFELKAGNIYMQFASEPDHKKVLETIKKYRKSQQRIFLGVVDVNNSEVEDPSDITELILEAANYIPVKYLGTTDDCGFSPFSDDRSTDRSTAFKKIRARVGGTKQAAKKLG